MSDGRISRKAVMIGELALLVVWVVWWFGGNMGWWG